MADRAADAAQHGTQQSAKQLAPELLEVLSGKANAQRRAGPPGARARDAGCDHIARQINASSPLRSSRFSNFSDGPLGRFSPISHWRTVDRLVLSIDASTA